MVYAAIAMCGALSLTAFEPPKLGQPFEDMGITLELVVSNEFVAITKGGIDRTDTLLGNIDLTLALDTQKAGWWDNGTFFLYGLGNYNSGSVPTELIGDVQATSNYDAPETAKLYEAWYEHRFMDGRLGVLFGLHDYNGEFYALEHAALFTHSSFGIGPDASQVGPSIFPTTALALRVRATPTPASYLLAAVYDGVPGDPGKVHGTQIVLGGSDGYFFAAEIGRQRPEESDDRYFKTGIGAWFHSDTADIDGSTSDNSGAYLIVETSLSAADNKGFGIFAQLGTAREDRNPIHLYGGAGIIYKGLWEAVDADQLGLAVAFAEFGDDFLNDTADGAGIPRSETAFELTYLMELANGLAIQPGIQYIINPASAGNISDAFMTALRVTYMF